MKPEIPTKVVVGAGGQTQLCEFRPHVVGPQKSAVACRMTRRRRRNLRSPAFAFSRGKLESSPILNRIRDNDIASIDLRELNAENREAWCCSFWGRQLGSSLIRCLFWSNGVTAYFHVANVEELFGCNTLDFEVYKDWIATSLAEGDPILGKVFEAIEEGFDNRIILYSLNANEFRRLYRALRRQDDVAVEFGKSNSKTAYAAKVWFELMERLARDRRNSEWEE